MNVSLYTKLVPKAAGLMRVVSECTTNTEAGDWIKDVISGGCWLNKTVHLLKDPKLLLKLDKILAKTMIVSLLFAYEINSLDKWKEKSSYLYRK